MLKLKRKRTTGIPAAFRGDKRIEKVIELLKAEQEIKKGNQEKHKFSSNWSPCKKQLHLESHQKCAYCEAPTTLVAYGDVEHYRPKSKYWWLAYCYDNYLASCTLCNQKYKKAKFEVLNDQAEAPVVKANDSLTKLKQMAKKVTPDPHEEAKGQSWSQYRKMHEKERPLLLNPYLDDPKDYFAWKVSHTQRRVELVPLDSQIELHVKMVDAAKKDYGINRKELCDHRYKAYVRYVEARLMSEDPDVPTNWRNTMKERKKELLKKEEPFSGMLSFFDKKNSQDLSLPG